MKKKSTHPMFLWKKIVLGVLLAIIGVLVAIFIGIFVWMQTWKTYEFPDGKGSMRYPSSWIEKDGGLRWCDSSILSKCKGFALITDRLDYFSPETHSESSVKQQANVLLNLYSYSPNGNESSDLAIKNHLTSQMNGQSYPKLKIIKIGVNTFYLANYAGDTGYAIFWKGRIYVFDSLLKNNSHIENFLTDLFVRLMLSTVRFK